MSKKDFGRRLIKWFENTMVDPDKIMDHLGVTKNPNKRAQLRDLARQIREETYGK